MVSLDRICFFEIWRMLTVHGQLFSTASSPLIILKVGEKGLVFEIGLNACFPQAGCSGSASRLETEYKVKNKKQIILGVLS